MQKILDLAMTYGAYICLLIGFLAGFGARILGFFCLRQFESYMRSTQGSELLNESASGWAAVEEVHRRRDILRSLVFDRHIEPDMSTALKRLIRSIRILTAVFITFLLLGAAGVAWRIFHL